MIKNFKQAWQILKQNKFYSAIYIAGAAISIAFVMTGVILLRAMTGDIHPENNRSRTMSIKTLASVDTAKGWTTSSHVSHKATEVLLEGVEGISAITEIYCPMEEVAQQVMSSEHSTSRYANISMVNHGFWNLFDIKYLHGAPFSEEDVEAKSKKMVITETFAQLLFQRTDVVGEILDYNFARYTICGVTEAVPVITSKAFADIWIPVSLSPNYESYLQQPADFQLLGYLSVLFLRDEGVSESDIQEQVAERLAQCNNTLQGRRYDLLEQPDPFYRSLLRYYSNTVPSSTRDFMTGFILFIFVILLIPSINLSGMISSSMQRRMEEMGIRKALGATNKSIMMQVLNENLLLTLFGGLIGLVLAYLVLLLAGQLFLSLLSGYMDSGIYTSYENGNLFHLESLFSPIIALIVLVASSLLNIMSAIIPARQAMKNNIVESLNSNKK